jgi:iron complex outermembrane receptor protein
VWAEHDYGVRASLSYKPTDKSEWLLTAVNGRNRVSYGWPMHGLRDPNNLANDCADPYTDTCVDALGERVYGFTHPYSTIQDKLSSTTIDTTMATLQGTWTLNSVALTSVTGFIHTHIRLTDDGASDYVGPGDIFFFDQNKHTDQSSEEFRVASIGSQRFNWTTGLFWSTDKFHGPTAYEFSLSPGTTNVTRTTDSYAVFAQSDYAFTPSVKLTTGLRYSKSKLSVSSTNLGGFFNSASDSWGSVGGRLALEKRLSDATLAYISYNRGFKEGNVNIGIYGSARPGRVSTIKPELIDALELGLKSDINRRLRTTTSSRICR